MSNSFANQTLAQLDLWAKKDSYKVGVYVLPKKLDEEVARLHLDKIGVNFTTLTPQAGRLSSACRWKGLTRLRIIVTKLPGSSMSRTSPSRFGTSSLLARIPPSFGLVLISLPRHG